MADTKEYTILGVLFILIVAYLLLFSQDFGIVYNAMLTGWLALLVLDINKRTSFKIEKNSQGRVMSFVLALICYGGFLMLSAFITSLLSPQSIASSTDYKTIIEFMSSTILQATQPVLRDSIILMAIGWTFLIGTIETVFMVGKLMEFISDRTRNSISNKVVMILLVGASSAVLHFTSKVLQNTPLMITFIFFTLSAIMVLIFGHLREAIFMHWIANAIAVLGLMTGFYFIIGVMVILLIADRRTPFAFPIAS